MPRSLSAGQDRPTHGSPVAALALATALLLFFFCLGAKPAAAAAFHSCASQKLENNGIFSLKASRAKCKVARQVAYARRSGDATPKGFSCVTGEGGNLTPFTCFRRDQVVKFSLEGQLDTRIEESDGPPPSVESTGMKLIYDESQSTKPAVLVGFFDSEEKMSKSAQVLEQMDSSETPGTRASVEMGEVKVEADA